jgi:MFS family permease
MTRTRYRWFIIFLLFAITVVNYIDRSAISYAIPMMQRDLGLSPADTGIIFGAFGLGYAISTLIGGFAVDRYGARVMLAVAAILWSLSIGATGFASGFTFLYAARLLLGLSEGPNFPALTGAVSHWLSPHERATALGYALLAVPLALAIGGPICTELLGWLHWRLTFVALFILSIAWVPLWYFLFRDDPAESRFVNAAELAHIRTSDRSVSAAPQAVVKSWPGPAVLKMLLTNRTLLANNWAFFVFGYFLFFFMTWLPSYLEQAYGLKLHTVGLFTVLPWLAAVVVVWLLARWSDHLLQTTGRVRVASSYLIAGSQFIAALAVIPVAFTRSHGGYRRDHGGGRGLDGRQRGSTVVNVDIVPKRAATALGIMEFAFAAQASWHRHHRLGAEPARLVLRQLPPDDGARFVLGARCLAVPSSRQGSGRCDSPPIEWIQTATLSISLVRPSRAATTILAGPATCSIGARLRHRPHRDTRPCRSRRRAGLVPHRPLPWNRTGGRRPLSRQAP